MIPRQAENKCLNYKCKVTGAISGKNSTGNLILESIHSMEAARVRSLDILNATSSIECSVVQSALTRLECSIQSLRQAKGGK